MPRRPTPDSAVAGKLFALFCLASYLLSLSYGSTFLLSLLISSRGGNEHDAGSVISAAILSTFAAVLVSGHLSDVFGAARSIALFGGLLVLAGMFVMAWNLVRTYRSAPVPAGQPLLPVDASQVRA